MRPMLHRMPLPPYGKRRRQAAHSGNPIFGPRNLSNNLRVTAVPSPFHHSEPESRRLAANSSTSLSGLSDCDSPNFVRRAFISLSSFSSDWTSTERQLLPSKVVDSLR